VPDEPTKPQVTTERSSTAENDHRTDERMRRDAKPAWWSLLILALLATVLLGIFGATSTSAVALVEMLLGATALSVGSFLGFLFGMPRPAFTVAAIADNGQTILAFDLTKLKKAPKRFRGT
jgi:CHASE2 domain-containing sensor protein